MARAAEGGLDRIYAYSNLVLVVLVQKSQGRVLKYLEAFRKCAQTHKVVI